MGQLIHNCCCCNACSAEPNHALTATDSHLWLLNTPPSNCQLISNVTNTRTVTPLELLQRMLIASTANGTPLLLRWAGATAQPPHQQDRQAIGPQPAAFDYPNALRRRLNNHHRRQPHQTPPQQPRLANEPAWPPHSSSVEVLIFQWPQRGSKAQLPSGYFSATM